MSEDEIKVGPLLRATKREQGGYNLTYENGVHMGELLMDVDGCYKYFPVLRGGYWDAPPLREIADMLDHLNKDWDEHVQKYFDKGVEE